MLRWNVWKLAVASIAAVALGAAGADEANAFGWRHHHHGSWGSSGGSYGSWGSSGGYYSAGSYGSWGSGGGSYGSWGYSAYRPVVSRRWGSWGSSGGSYGSWGSSGGSSAGYASSGGSSGGWGSSGGSSGGWGSSGGSSGGYSTMRVDGDSIVDPNAAPPAAPAPAAPAPMGATAPSNSATLNVTVPEGAKVYVNGMATTSTGSSRRYVSNGLEPGFSYTYELKAELVRDGKTVTESKTVKMQAGEATGVNFGFGDEGDNQVAKEPARTSLTLMVPADAKVYLGGNVTASNGEVREFATTQLTTGEEWKDYVVRVEIERDGQTFSKETVLTLHGGESRKLALDFDAPEVASVANQAR